MRTRSQIIMMGIFLSILLLIGGGAEPPSNTCICATPSLDKQIRRADLIFEGIALARHGYPTKQLEGLGVKKPLGLGDSEYVFFYATTVWKGSKLHEYVVSTPKDSGGCGYPFKEGKRYIVYADVEGTQASTDLCTRTRRASGADKDREKLNDMFGQ